MKPALSCASKYGMDTLLEGYGVTEASPVVAANQIEANHPGTVGRLMAGMEARLEPVEGIPNARACSMCSGPNVMLGYIRPDAPGKIVPPEDGWYDTGDVVSSTKTASSPSVAGSSVSPRSAARPSRWRSSKTSPPRCGPTMHHAAVAMPDGRKGEQIVLVTDAKEAQPCGPDRLGPEPRRSGNQRPAPGAGGRDSIPLLATGKTDYVSVQKMAATETAG